MTELKDYYLINHETGYQYVFKTGGRRVVVYINDGNDWRPYDDTRVAGNYQTHMARTLWDELVKEGFTTQ